MLLGGIAIAEETRDVTVESRDVESRGKPAEELKGYDAEGGSGKKIFEVPIEGTIDLGLAPFVERVIDAAGPEDVVILNITTFGGRIDAAVRIRDALIDAEATTVAFINGRAISAGALIALSCDTIIMKPGATIGDAMPIQLGSDGKANPTGEKAISYMRAEMRATAESKGRSGDLAEAMVDPDIEIEDIVKKDKLLTLTTDQAIEHDMADATAKNFDAVVALLNLTQAKRVSTKTHWAEKIARLLTDPVISSLLMTFGV
ncbi:MAG: ATP-dependent Clp protease proteolytic subunit, partial [Myxococcota bacterium]